MPPFLCSIIKIVIINPLSSDSVYVNNSIHIRVNSNKPPQNLFFSHVAHLKVELHQSIPYDITILSIRCNLVGQLMRTSHNYMKRPKLSLQKLVIDMVEKYVNEASNLPFF